MYVYTCFSKSLHLDPIYRAKYQEVSSIFSKVYSEFMLFPTTFPTHYFLVTNNGFYFVILTCAHLIISGEPHSIMQIAVQAQPVINIWLKSWSHLSEAVGNTERCGRGKVISTFRIIYNIFSCVLKPFLMFLVSSNWGLHTQSSLHHDRSLSVCKETLKQCSVCILLDFDPK